MDLSLNSPLISFGALGKSLTFLSLIFLCVKGGEQLNTHKSLNAILKQSKCSVVLPDSFSPPGQKSCLSLSFLPHHCHGYLLRMHFLIFWDQSLWPRWADPMPPGSLASKRVQMLVNEHEAPGEWTGINPGLARITREGALLQLRLLH